MRRMSSYLLAASMILAGAALPAAAQQPTGRGPVARGGGGRGNAMAPGDTACPAGQTEIRPRMCMAPQLDPPSILDYRPRTTLVADAHMVKTAKYAAIDFHGHPNGLIFSEQGLDSLGRALDGLNVRMMVSADNLSGEPLKSAIAAVKASARMHDRVRILAGIDFRNVGPGWAAKAIAQLDADVAAGAVGVGEISKSLGLSIRKPDGSRLKIDDPELDPIWTECARLKIPVFIHTADPEEFFRPLDYNNE
ncbi:MAG TPA: hypothetical protein VGI97_04395, partial [Gemmatimonadaceae bacterium]